uniref:Lon N-terminal domain-containing protein n=1 Tax=Oryza glumipatula TaxID=40148 RepID=A0A0E0BGS6_9ORYZ
MAASALLRLLSPSSPASLHARATRRRHPRAVVRCSSPSPASLDLPLLPFQPAEVLIPSECKTLHLYEARYLALLEEALYRKNNSFVHFVLDPVVSGSPKASFAVRHGCLVQIESVERLDIGALVSIRGVCRVNIINLLQVPEDEPLQTNIKASLLWSEKEIFEEYNEGFIPALPERLSFAAYQTVSGMSEAELLSLQKYKIQAMDSTNTLERLNSGIEYMRVGNPHLRIDRTCIIDTRSDE